MAWVVVVGNDAFEASAWTVMTVAIVVATEFVGIVAAVVAAAASVTFAVYAVEILGR